MFNILLYKDLADRMLIGRGGETTDWEVLLLTRSGLAVMTGFRVKEREEAIFSGMQPTFPDTIVH